MKRYTTSLAMIMAVVFTQTVQAGPRDRAKLMFERIAGIPPTAETLDAMTTHLAAGRRTEAAAIALAHPSFYNLALKNWITPWTNVARQNDQPLNDYTATVIGMIRDNVPFDQVLYGDQLYVGAQALVTAGTIAARANDNNNHYRDLETALVDLSNPANLVSVSQSATTGIADTAGVLTTRASGEAYFSAGTNRRVFRFTSMNYLCRDLELLQDTSVSDYRVRRDVDRSPGGDSRVFKNRCVGCHGLQDGLGGAFAYFNFNDNRLQHTPGTVQGKLNQNGGIFSPGYQTTDDSWVNLITVGRNASLGWRSPAGVDILQGRGARSLGRMLAATRAFSSCAVEKVFQKVCLRAPTVQERSKLEQITDAFESSNYAIKPVFAEVTQFCLGE